MKSSISQLLPTPGRLSGRLSGRLRQAIGRELRRQRLDRGLTQAQLAGPLTKAFVSAVEHGRAVPSLPALQLMVERLDTTLSEFFARVEQDVVDPNLTLEYDPRHEYDRDPGQDAAARGGRPA
jgi:transcriptional regulator with XRE-family HTH domain